MRFTLRNASRIPGLIFFLGAIVFFGIWNRSLDHQEKTLRLKSELTAEQVGIRLEEYIADRLNVVELMMEHWKRGQINTQEAFRLHALEVQKKFSGLLAINWIDSDGFIRWVVPEEPNKDAKNKSLREHKTARKTFLDAERTKSRRVTPPVDLLQGGRGMASYFPIVVDGKILGYVNGVFRLGPMIEDCLRIGIKENFNFLISYRDGPVYWFGEIDDAPGQLYKVSYDFHVDSQNWKITLIPNREMMKKSFSHTIDFALAVGLIMLAGLSLLTRRLIIKENLIRQSEQRYKEIFENSQVGLFRVEAGEGKMLDANSHLAQMFGYENREVFIRELSMKNQWVDPNKRERMYDILERTHSIPSIETQFKRKDGSIFWARFSVNYYPEINCVEGVAIDITEEKKAMGALAESEEKYRTIFETTGTATIIFGDDAVITLANSGFATLMGYSRDEIEGQMTWMDFVHKDFVEQMKGYHRRRPESPNSVPRIYETRFVSREKRMIDGILTINMISGTRLRVASFLDMTERKKVEQQLFQAEKMASLGQIIAGIAHEINNPNNFIFFNLPILKRYLEGALPVLNENAKNNEKFSILNMGYEQWKKDVFKLIENMHYGSERITGIVSELKTYIHSHEQEHKRPEKLPKVVDHVMTLIGKQVQKMVKKFEQEVEEELPPVLMNEGKIEQVLINLLINAGQAADKEDSTVRLEVRKSKENEDNLEVIVEDNGCGMEKDVLQQIFDPFFTTKGRDAGTGLGLSISQRIVEEHGGKILVESEKGRGSRFTVRLPVFVEGEA